MERAIRSMTSLPAQIVGIEDRGIILQGLAADVVVFDPLRVRDRATFVNPHQLSEGIDYVFVNGKAVVDNGKLTGALPGAVLTRPHARKMRPAPEQ
jgi:N-acyl-D-aspartate/D-glutamate deacylase